MADGGGWLYIGRRRAAGRAAGGGREREKKKKKKAWLGGEGSMGFCGLMESNFLQVAELVLFQPALDTLFSTAFYFYKFPSLFIYLVVFLS